MINSKSVLFVALLGLVLNFGCSSANNRAATSVQISFTVISTGNLRSANFEDPKILETYTDQAAYDNAQAQYSLPVDEEVIDFTTDQVVLVTMGGQSNGGYSISAESAADAGDYIELNMILSAPGENCVTTQEITHPYQLLKINMQKEVRINERNVVENCE